MKNGVRVADARGDLVFKDGGGEEKCNGGGDVFYTLDFSCFQRVKESIA